MDYWKKYVEYIRRLEKEHSNRFDVLFTAQKTLNKFIWSVSKPPTPLQNRIAMVSELNEILNELKPMWKWWGNGGDVNRDNLLEEIVDWLHFYLTFVQLELEEKNEWKFFRTNEPSSDPLVEILEVISMTATAIPDHLQVTEVMMTRFMNYFGIKEEDIFVKYIEKSFENYMRQVGNGRYGKVPMSVFEDFISRCW